MATRCLEWQGNCTTMAICQRCLPNGDWNDCFVGGELFVTSRNYFESGWDCSWRRTLSDPGGPDRRCFRATFYGHRMQFQPEGIRIWVTRFEEMNTLRNRIETRGVFWTFLLQCNLSVWLRGWMWIPAARDSELYVCRVLNLWLSSHFSLATLSIAYPQMECVL